MSSFDSEIVDINVYAMQLLKGTCPTMDEREMLKVANNLIEEATVEVDKREKLRRQLKKQTKLAAKRDNYRNEVNSLCKKQNNITAISRNTVCNEDTNTNFHGGESFQNHRKMNIRHGNRRHRNFSANNQTWNYPRWYNQSDYEKYGMVPYNNFNRQINWQNDFNNISTPAHNYYQKRKREMPHGNIGCKRMRS